MDIFSGTILRMRNEPKPSPESAEIFQKYLPNCLHALHANLFPCVWPITTLVICSTPNASGSSRETCCDLSLESKFWKSRKVQSAVAPPEFTIWLNPMQLRNWVSGRYNTSSLSNRMSSFLQIQAVCCS